MQFGWLNCDYVSVLVDFLEVVLDDFLLAFGRPQEHVGIGHSVLFFEIGLDRFFQQKLVDGFSGAVQI